MRAPVIRPLRAAFEREWLRALRMQGRRGGKNGPGLESDAVPVEPNRPNDLSGGAAAALEFDE